MWGSAALGGVTGTSRTADGQRSRPGSDSLTVLLTGVDGAGGGDGVPGITRASVMRRSSASGNLLRSDPKTDLLRNFSPFGHPFRSDFHTRMYRELNELTFV